MHEPETHSDALHVGAHECQRSAIIACSQPDSRGGFKGLSDKYGADHCPQSVVAVPSEMA